MIMHFGTMYNSLDFGIMFYYVMKVIGA